MGQKSLIYSFVARGKVILAEYTEFKGNFTTVAAQCLEKLPPNNNRFTYNCDGHTFNYLIDNGYSKPKLKEQMVYCVTHPEEIDKIAKVKAQVLDRGEKIELLVDKTDNLRNQANDFKKQGTKMKRKMWVQNMKIKLIVGGLVLVLILLVVMSICNNL
ncbi:Longin domain-containing protein, partial [Cynara cardunculus var. scolymus]